MACSDNGNCDRFATWDHLGSCYPFHVAGSHRFHVEIASALDEVPAEQRKIDPVGIVEILGIGHLLDNRTLICGLQRSPWMGYPVCHGRWEYAETPEHGDLLLPTNTVAAALRQALRCEARRYLSDSRCAGILLSGGLDSRVVAGTVRQLQLTGEFAGDIVALTWGLVRSRDVNCAQEIARRYNWDWVHFPLGPEVLAENIYVAGEMGAEFSPIHLHALPKVRQLNGIDVILAGSYGDSIGRGEYSGRRIHQLRPIVPPFLNRFRLLKGEVVRASRASVLQDAYGYRQETERKARCQYRELEHAMHYMRRKLQVCMSYVADRIPLFQLFTAPETFGLMWSLAPSIRDDRFYAALLPSLPGAIATLPWSRTGQPLGRSEGDKAAGSAVFHEYGTWLRRDLRTMIIQLVTSDTIKQLNVFNELALKRIVKLWPRATTTTTNSIDETLSWMASLAVFIDRYGIQPPDGAPASWCGALDALLGEAWAWGYQSARGRLRQ